MTITIKGDVRAKAEQSWIRKSKIDAVNVFTATLTGEGGDKKHLDFTYVHPEYWPPGLSLYLATPWRLTEKGKNATDNSREDLKVVMQTIEKVLIKHSHLVLFNSLISDNHKHSILHTLIEEVALFEGYDYKTKVTKSGFYFEISDMNMLLEYNQLSHELRLTKNIDVNNLNNIVYKEIDKDKPMRDFLVSIYIDVSIGSDL